MAGYFLVDILWTNNEGRERYVKAISETMAPYGGVFLASVPEVRVMEGEWPLENRLVLIRFPSAERALAWYGSEEYAPLLRIRQQSSRSKIVFFEGD